MTAATKLVAEVARALRPVLRQALGRLGHTVRAVDTATALWDRVQAGEGDLVITDVMMPDGNGLDLLPRIRNLRPDLRVIVMSARNTLLTAVRANEQGAFEYLPKPFDLTELTATVDRALSTPSRDGRPREPAAANDDGQGPDPSLPLIGRSAAMQNIYRVMARLMHADLTVMITGESGTGKELIARALHDFGKRKAGPFVALNMAAIPRELIESELFGHEKGALTGATTRTDGRFEQARGGTLFLDEIGDMPMDAQTRLLRVLQEGEYTTVGGRAPIKVDVRIIAATHRDLRQLIAQGAFREDLFYRLNVVPLRLPPLRERVEDIEALVEHFLTRAASEGLGGKILDPGAMDRLRRHRWPGNVRELENLVRRLSALYSQEVIDTEVIERELAGGDGADPATTAVTEGLSASVERHLKDYFGLHGSGVPPPGLYDRVLEEVEKPLIRLTLAATGGNQIKAATVLGLNRNTLRKKIRDLDIPIVRGNRPSQDGD